ncbi:SHROOM [Mytilus coruscus]|uniref:SHROOM n=1 Tax=Mytilus coruscus TaxID=42192 RepID=A0A6J8A655_MYTCO|nr:SHROOM [Mytilus coruscus]
MSTSNIDNELKDTSIFDSFSFSDSEVLPNVSNQRKPLRKSKKIPRNEEVTTDFQFDRFGDEGNAIRVPLTDKIFKSGVQLQCIYKGNTGTKFVSTTFYTNGTILVQGKHTCTEWRDTYFSKIKDKVNFKENEVSNTLCINDGQTHQIDVLPENDSMIDSQTVPNDISSIQDNTIIHQNVNTASHSTALPSDLTNFHSFPDKVVNLLQSLNSNIFHNDFTKCNAYSNSS